MHDISAPSTSGLIFHYKYNQINLCYLLSHFLPCKMSLPISFCPITSWSQTQGRTFEWHKIQVNVCCVSGLASKKMEPELLWLKRAEADFIEKCNIILLCSLSLSEKNVFLTAELF